MNSQKRLKLLLTNDDGIEAEGISVLRNELKEVADIYVLSPDSNRSAVSSHFVLFNNIKFRKVEENVYCCSGFPTDCVIAAVQSDLFKNVKFDAVISGINKGPNLGTDCVYSGTVAAARQAVIYGIPGIALSLKSQKSEYAAEGYDYKPLAQFVKNNLDSIIGLYKPDCIININALSVPEYKGVKFTSLCFRDYKDKVVITESDEQGLLEGSTFTGTLETTGPEDNDWKATNEGFISISGVHAEPVSYQLKDQHSVTFNF